jgi:alpha-glucosidase
MAYTDAPNSQECLTASLQKSRIRSFPAEAFIFHRATPSIGEGRYVFNWNYDKLPNPAKFIKDFADGGINIIPNIKPAFLTSHPMYDELRDKGLFIKNPDGTPFVTQFWDGLGSYLDFTNPDAFDFWKKQVKEKLLDFGIIATWNDNNEFDIKDCEALTNGGINADLLRPTLTYLMVFASYQAQIADSPNLRPFLSTRSGGIGVRRLAQTWSGDNRTAFEDLRYCHNIGLTMSLSGLYFYGHDLGGFTGNMPSRELLLRWLQHGIFEPRFTIHSWNSDGSATMPWSYPDILPSVQALFRQRRRLLPYSLQLRL